MHASMWFEYDTPSIYLVHYSCAIEIVPHVAFISLRVCTAKLQ